jgi:hypothetical protein
LVLNCESNCRYYSEVCGHGEPSVVRETELKYHIEGDESLFKAKPVVELNCG